LGVRQGVPGAFRRLEPSERIRHLRPLLDPYKRKFAICYHNEPLHIAEDMIGRDVLPHMYRFPEAVYQEYVRNVQSMY
jgi:hypothetical protein